MHQSTTSGTSSNTAHWWREPPLLLAIALVFVLYFGRLTVLPIRGEENTWATIAQEMIASGDWIVPRLQGDVFIDRPPLHSQMMGALGVLRGRVDLVAIRLPSVVAVLLTTVLIYAYGRSFLVPAGAFAAAVGFATMGQVLDLGRLGENEAVFTCLLSAALVSWHWLYLRDRRLAA